MEHARCHQSASLANYGCDCFIFIFVSSYNSQSCHSGPHYHYRDFPEHIPWDSGLQLKNMLLHCHLGPHEQQMLIGSEPTFSVIAPPVHG